ncbi:hypothetical protein EMIHUDRAFT_420431 [Emiliania huxleyi CCMP1516]|uniref:Thioredoxin domain-containing protein n=2 Tax=Emiliania huxleyi TaxID=2903 RepID=A0A0D3J4H4_EMIH1|nr:hypothetical protein EMIHUDRAFT_420431 [Emiliania huxleyi CCMP1516]EOD18409.1 hypothetical protein EMIHUDRAFT_420431 [Emiliania huxleyi CCMP1516]|mmetsp:Transcript_16658/g.53911  ORF Transcript_16658/g.53911 Transcript_16658/m.53911 type:complete len:155 (+) Transcript_16658:59-523(+)|eukprot:XP_005770838.1 hypothetical protein EMIHUDRAFT_420431 [Emiliania huxleyi CCMP1516]
MALDAIVAFVQQNPILVLMVLYIFYRMFQSRQPWPDYGGNITAVKSLEDWRSLLNGSSLTLVDCYATWCPPCKAAAPVFARMSEEYPDVTFAKVNVDDAADVAKQLGISAMPTFKLFRGSEELGTQRGWSEGQVREMLDKAGAVKGAQAGAKAE